MRGRPPRPLCCQCGDARAGKWTPIPGGSAQPVPPTSTGRLARTGSPTSRGSRGRTGGSGLRPRSLVGGDSPSSHVLDRRRRPMPHLSYCTLNGRPRGAVLATEPAVGKISMSRQPCGARAVDPSASSAVPTHSNKLRLESRTPVVVVPGTWFARSLGRGPSAVRGRYQGLPSRVAIHARARQPLWLIGGEGASAARTCGDRCDGHGAFTLRRANEEDVSS